MGGAAQLMVYYHNMTIIMVYYHNMTIIMTIIMVYYHNITKYTSQTVVIHRTCFFIYLFALLLWCWNRIIIIITNDIRWVWIFNLSLVCCGICGFSCGRCCRRLSGSTAMTSELLSAAVAASRFMVRCLGKNSISLLEPLVTLVCHLICPYLCRIYQSLDSYIHRRMFWLSQGKSHLVVTNRTNILYSRNRNIRHTEWDCINTGPIKI